MEINEKYLGTYKIPLISKIWVGRACSPSPSPHPLSPSPHPPSPSPHPPSHLPPPPLWQVRVYGVWTLLLLLIGFIAFNKYDYELCPSDLVDAWKVRVRYLP